MKRHHKYKHPIKLFESHIFIIFMVKGSNGLMDNVSASQPRDHGFEPHMGHDHDSSYDTSTG